jgi:hypothetical protein
MFVAAFRGKGTQFTPGKYPGLDAESIMMVRRGERRAERAKDGALNQMMDG